MTKSLIKLNEYFVIETDSEGNEVEVIYEKK